MGYNLEQMVVQHTGLVKSVAKRLSFIYGEDIEDLIQIGYVGLIKAIRGFDETKGHKFSTYAVPMITGEIKSQLRDQGKIKVSRSVKKDIITVKKAEVNYMAQNGRSPRISELARVTGLSEEQVSTALQARDALNNMENYEELRLAIGNDEQCITKIDLRNTLAKLDSKERQVIVLRYYRDMTQQQVANVLGLSQVQVSRIEKKSLKCLCEFMSG